LAEVEPVCTGAQLPARCIVLSLALVGPGFGRLLRRLLLRRRRHCARLLRLLRLPGRLVQRAALRRAGLLRLQGLYSRQSRL
jgi:hypothetical protein